LNISNDVQKGSISMYARVVTGQYQPGKLDEGEQMYRESILPEARRQPGFKGILGLVDRSSGKAISITLWQTEADAQASGASSSYGQAQLTKIASLLAAAPTIETYEVVAQE
jgi:heme-degrading monooxygenase HmoA